MIKETAEISSNENWVESYLTDNDIHVPTVEGYSVDDGDVATCIDRRRVDDVRAYTPGRAWREFSSTIQSEWIDAKLKLSELADVPYFVVVYDDKWARVYRMSEDGFDDVMGLVTHDEFGTWVFEFASREKLNKSFINSSSLPEFDETLRENGTPWPSNLDAFWWDEDNIRCLIEFQTTNKAKPCNHSNNRYFDSDKSRWWTLHSLRTTVERPMLIIVWSPNDDWNDIRVKKVGEIEFHGRDRGLNYRSDVMLQKEELIDHMEEIV